MPGQDKPRLTHFAPGSSEFIDKASQARPGIQVFPDRLYVLTMLENPLRWRSRYANYHVFADAVEAAGAVLLTAEVALGARRFEITEPGNPHHLQLRSRCEIWHKENVLNLLAQRLPEDARCIATIDADVVFARADWAQETLHLLQHYDVLQMFSQVYNLGPRQEVLTTRGAFMWNHVENRHAPHHPEFNRPLEANPGYSGAGNGRWNHTGFAWAYRRSAWNTMGGLIDWAILGSGDYHMATALVGQVEKSLNRDFPPRYQELCRIWEERVRAIRENPNGGVGYMPGAILHHFHGTTANRAYKDRWRLLARTQYNPDLDLKRDHQGLWQLTARSPELRDGLRAYARMRDEDSPVTAGML
jgi:hypothetical protein